MNKLSMPSRIIISVASLSLIACYFLPIWFIYLTAPQYPEGLTMNIWLSKITGQVEIINGLNHYIGMKLIKAEMFPEFKYLNYIIGFYIICGLVVAITAKRKWLLGLITITILGGIVAMVDFFKWGYDYGHNLDPKAAIQIPGLTYQPPLIGHKKLLNFDAYSYPDAGGWIFIGVACIFMLTWFIEWKRNKAKKAITADHRITSLAASFLILFFSSCSTAPQPFRYGKDICSDCKMTIVDKKFGAQLITKKGKVYLFDDAHCIINFEKKGIVKAPDISKIVFTDFENSDQFIDSRSAVFVISPKLKTPMNSFAAAFSSRQAAEKKLPEMPGTISNWEELFKKL